jgi:YD repeat-containing protein
MRISLPSIWWKIVGRQSESYGYDTLGNRSGGQYNANNELLGYGELEYHYDENGNATQLLLDGEVMFSYHYNAQDRLVKVEEVNGGTIAEYAYDPFGRRLWKEVGGTRTSFFYADERLVAEYDTAGNETTSPTPPGRPTRSG